MCQSAVASRSSMLFMNLVKCNAISVSETYIEENCSVVWCGVVSVRQVCESVSLAAALRRYRNPCNVTSGYQSLRQYKLL